MFFNERCRDDLDINITNQNVNSNMNENYAFASSQMMGQPMMEQPMMGSVMNPVIEPGRERVVNRTFVHEVPHVCPINTRIINNHIYRHTYQPRYTCCEENVVTNEQCGSCCNFN